jgi:hypothetical protein
VTAITMRGYVRYCLFGLLICVSTEMGHPGKCFQTGQIILIHYGIQRSSTADMEEESASGRRRNPTFLKMRCTVKLSRNISAETLLSLGTQDWPWACLWRTWRLDRSRDS